MDGLSFFTICDQGEQIQIALSNYCICNEVVALPVEENNLTESSNSVICAASSLGFIVVFEVLRIDPFNSLANLL